MTLPNQPSINDATERNQEIYRIRRPITGPGDVVEIDASTRAIYIGPESDIAEVNLQYFDPSEPAGAFTAVVSPNGPFAGRLDANMAGEYPSGQVARILASPGDIVDPAYTRPAAAPFIPARRFNLPVYLDLLCALKDYPNIPQVRPDRTYRLPQVPFDNDGAPPTDGSTDVVIPIYGRKLLSVQLVVPTFVGLFATFSLATVVSGAAQTPVELGQLTIPATSIAQTFSVVIRASQDLAAMEDPALPEAFEPFPIVGPVGQADLLVLNLAPNFVMPPPGASFVDLFLRLSDREA